MLSSTASPVTQLEEFFPSFFYAPFVLPDEATSSESWVWPCLPMKEGFICKFLGKKNLKAQLYWLWKGLFNLSSPKQSSVVYLLTVPSATDGTPWCAGAWHWFGTKLVLPVLVPMFSSHHPLKNTPNVGPMRVRVFVSFVSSRTPDPTVGTLKAWRAFMSLCPFYGEVSFECVRSLSEPRLSIMGPHWLPAAPPHFLSSCPVSGSVLAVGTCYFI